MLVFLFKSCMAFVSGIVTLAFMAFTVWMIIDCATKEPRQGNERLIWIIIMVFVPYFGALIYYLVRRPERIRAYGMRPPGRSPSGCQGPLYGDERVMKSSGAQQA